MHIFWIEGSGGHFKVTGSFMQARDWPAENGAPTAQALVGRGNPGGYDAVNPLSATKTPTPGLITLITPATLAISPLAWAIYHRTGYWEKDLVDYTARSIKLGAGLYFRPTPTTRLRIHR